MTPRYACTLNMGYDGSGRAALFGARPQERTAPLFPIVIPGGAQGIHDNQFFLLPPSPLEKSKEYLRYSRIDE